MISCAGTPHISSPTVRYRVASMHGGRSCAGKRQPRGIHLPGLGTLSLHARWRAARMRCGHMLKPRRATWKLYVSPSAAPRIWYRSGVPSMACCRRRSVTKAMRRNRCTPYWDDFWALKGYEEAVAISRVLGHQEATTRLTRQRDEFRHDLYASLAASTAAHGIAYLPGCAELGDFDATATTIALDPVGEQAHLPQDRLLATFERYWQAFVARRDGVTPWNDYTPMSCALWGHFVRLGWRQRAQELLDFFLPTGGRPAGTNGPKSWVASCASRALWAICRMAGWRPTSSARRSTSSPMHAKPIARSCWPPTCPGSGWRARGSRSRTCVRRMGA